ncbi:helix-turn-helix domain-containing protein [Nocardiopsis suaedae]|uniref:Helix-turn-helix domain-containing protein n=1 Tax=Nocardiopsis suaedae TaxID=3018444 RepID=A0ABT4TSU7_9ACTN|nr:helix-turn-helix domain-containing protein [Nocardiopsis suaedae]MDA2807764.1 helix-turn-helix domain-containing protein [Nocardiopsis suaedae]
MPSGSEPPAPSPVTLRAFAHPLRLRLLSLLTGAAMSAAEAARELGESQANVSYHVRRLHEAGLLTLAEEVQVRGGRALRYRHDPASGPATAQGGAEDLRMLTAALAEELRRRSRLRDPEPPRTFTDTEVWVAPEEWAALVERASELGEELHRAARAPRSPGAIPVSASLLFFALRTADGPDSGEGGDDRGEGDPA